MPLASAWQRALNLWYDMADTVKSPNVVALNAKLGSGSTGPTWQFRPVILLRDLQAAFFWLSESIQIPSKDLDSS